MRSYIAFRYPIIVRPNLTPRSEFHENLNEVLGSYLKLEFLTRDFAVTKFKGSSIEWWMVVIITMGARDFSWASFRFRSILYQKSRENELINSCVYILLFLPWISILAFIKERMVSYVFFFFFIFWEEKTGGSSERTPDKFSDTYPEVLETSPKKEGKCSCENSVW